MDPVASEPSEVVPPKRNAGPWIATALSVVGLIVIAVIVFKTVNSDDKGGAGFGPVTRVEDRAVQADLRNALTAEKTIYTDTQTYSVSIATMKSIEPSLDWGGALTVVVGDAVNRRDGGIVCLSEQSKSGTTFSLGDISAGMEAGTYYGRSACPSAATPATIGMLDTSW